MGKRANAGRPGTALPAVGATAMSPSRSHPAQREQMVPKPLLFCQKKHWKTITWGLSLREGLGKGHARQRGPALSGAAGTAAVGTDAGVQWGPGASGSIIPPPDLGTALPVGQGARLSPMERSLLLNYL